MMPKYLFIDDETGTPTKALLDGFNDTKIVTVESMPLTKGETIESVCYRIKDLFSSNQYDGVLIDLCLDGTGENSLAFKAQPFAQQIRTWAAEEKMPHVPVVLCSTLENYDIYKKDSASHDLFDYYFDKTDVNFRKESTRLKSISEGYLFLSKKGVSIEEYLGRNELDAVDSKIIDFLKGQSVYETAKSMIKDVIPYSGILVDQCMVAARMGINKDESKEGWKILREAIEKDAAYKGVFCEGWQRFWSDQVNAFFMKLSGGKPYQIMSAAERVEVLKNNGFDGLSVARPIDYNNSSYFNTVCCYSGQPLDSMEGIPVEDRMSLMQWQENHYVSFFFVAKGDFKEENLCREGLKKMEEIKQIIKDGQV